jgi:hypothetical protein
MVLAWLRSNSAPSPMSGITVSSASTGSCAMRANVTAHGNLMQSLRVPPEYLVLGASK